MLSEVSPRGRMQILRWTTLGTLFCVVFAVAFNFVLFRDLGEPALTRALFSSAVVASILATPSFFYLSLKLRQLAKTNHRLNTIASLDGLTGCLTRRAFSTLVDDWLHGGDVPDETKGDLACKRPGTLLVIDADRFKSINDRFGHQCGDEALCVIAAAIRSSMRIDDLVGRLGGEEFGVFLPGTVDPSEIAERIRRKVETASFSPQECPHQLTVSIGGASISAGGTFNHLYRLADERLYEAKRGGRNRIAVGPVSNTVPPLRLVSQNLASAS
ncbi:diguanylate cyclase (GGDEF)-like protein [Rhodopseudomonas julia]|uniref:diguanylate cyclase n=1 Tax=Rhodopseudomonas julia TaxID=200617 RepID=A0ABU0C3D6_9BRAD|nr:GGDEF domain-containing protein [Rhodopseudomonas julia]MDQ0325024.1 diguanylate cyclase (GGDEF)-like protein [Rhodopseudomonas julia]